MEIKIADTKEQSKKRLEKEKLRKIFISKINREINKDDIFAYFSEFGEIESLKHITRKKKVQLLDESFAFLLFHKE